jgi:hypothetical protein
MEEFTPPHLTNVEGNETAQMRLQLVREYKRRIEAETALPQLEILREEVWNNDTLRHFDKQTLEPMCAGRVRVLTPPKQY